MGTRDQILNLKMVIEKNREYGKNICLCFIDYSKAFDMVSQELLWKGMLEMGFSSHIVLTSSRAYILTKVHLKEQQTD